jgi:hypothetical protein
VGYRKGGRIDRWPAKNRNRIFAVGLTLCDGGVLVWREGKELD